MALTALISALALLGAPAIEPIGPGSAAPTLDVKTWYKGTPVKAFEANKIYVVEFWATWCGPCKTSIPHLTELAKKNSDVTFIGVSIWEDDNGTNIADFVKGMGDKMDYNVGYSGNKVGMSQTWMEAAGQNGIPSSFIVKNNQIQWIGHPMTMDKPLADIKAGTFDVAGFKANFDKQAEATRKEMAANKALSAAVKLHDDGKAADADAALKKVVAEYPQMADSAEVIRFDWLFDKDAKAWEVKAKQLLASGKEADTQTVLSFALRRIQQPAKFVTKDAKTVEKVAPNYDATKRALALANAAKPNDFSVLWYSANAYQRIGEAKLGLEAVNKLITIFPTSPAKDSPGFKENLDKMKAEFEAKLAKPGA